MGKSKQVGLPSLSSSCLVIVVHVAFPRGATGLSAVFYCGISWSSHLLYSEKNGVYLDSFPPLTFNTVKTSMYFIVPDICNQNECLI